MTHERFRRTLITSALPYANGYLHLGHIAGAYLPADIYTRWLRSIGHDVIHVSGSDEHGVPITISADKEGVTPKEIVDKYHHANETAFGDLHIDFDVYGRTSWPEHHETAQEFFRALHSAGYLSEREEEQFYDVDAGMFLPDRYVEGTCPNCGNESARGDQCDRCSATYDQTELIDPISKISGKKPELRSTRHAYLKLGEFQARLESYVESHRREWRDHVVQQSKSWLKAGLGDRAITRDLEWGVPVPMEGYEKKVLYVWFDAPFGYITNTRVLAERSGDPDGWRKWWQDPESRYVAFIGKDNIVFHTLIFPAALMGYNDSKDPDGQYILPDNVPACEFLNLEGEKFSKSRNWGVDVRDYLQEHPADPLRYVLAANMPENKDADFTWREYQARVNNELADILGNFVNRTATFLDRYYDGVLPPLTPKGEKEESMRNLVNEDLTRLGQSGRGEEEILDELEPKYLKYFGRNELRMLMILAAAPERIAERYDAFRFRDAILETMNVARAANKYFNDSAPWKSRKENPDRCATSLNLCAQVIRSLAVLFEPVLPETAEKIRRMLNLEELGAWASVPELRIPAGHRIGEPVILFEKFTDEQVESEVAKLGGGTEESESSISVDVKPSISFEDVMELDLRVATVLQAEKIKKSNKLLKLQVRFGDQTRQIVAGVAKRYSPEDLVGRKIVVVANLKSAKLMGIESQGMLLAANDPDGESPPVVLTIDDPDVRDGFEVR